MSHVASPPAVNRKAKRRAPTPTTHTVAKVVMATLLSLGLLSGLSVAYLYRHLTDNLTYTDYTHQLSNRPDAVDFNGHQPVNILVMGSDTRAGEGNRIDNEVGQGQRSDTTILFHLSGDRTRAYGVSIPRDSLVTRPDCKTASGEVIAGAERSMWNEAYNVAGPACTIQQFEQTTGIRLDHYVVVDFAGFEDMVDAIGGVEVCIPYDVEDTDYGITLAAGTREVSGREALSYVRERHGIGDGSDLGRIKRQQAFVASMAHKVVSAGTLANPYRLFSFLDAATASLEVDKGMGDLMSIAQLGNEFRNIGLDKIKFVTVPWELDPIDPNRVVWREPEAAELWEKVKYDKPLTKDQSEGAITAAKPTKPKASDNDPNVTGLCS